MSSTFADSDHVCMYSDGNDVAVLILIMLMGLTYTLCVCICIRTFTYGDPLCECGDGGCMLVMLTPFSGVVSKSVYVCSHTVNLYACMVCVFICFVSLT